MRDFDLLNWDHDINPTPKADLLENIRFAVCSFTGWEKLFVEIDKGILSIGQPDGQLFKLDLNLPLSHELLDSIRYLGFTAGTVISLKKVILSYKYLSESNYFLNQRKLYK